MIFCELRNDVVPLDVRIGISGVRDLEREPCQREPGIPGAGADPESAGCVGRPVGVQPEARRSNRGLGARESQGPKAHVMALARAVVDRLLETDTRVSFSEFCFALERAARAISNTRRFTLWLRSRSAVPTSPASLVIFFPAGLVSGTMDVGFHHRRIDAHASTRHNSLFESDLNDPLMNLLEYLRPHRHAPAPGLGVRHLAAAYPGEVAVDEVGAHFTFELRVAPVADMLENQQS